MDLTHLYEIDVRHLILLLPFLAFLAAACITTGVLCIRYARRNERELMRLEALEQKGHKP